MKQNWRTPSLSELIAIIFNIGLTHLGSKAYNCLTLSSFLYHMYKRLAAMTSYMRQSTLVVVCIKLTCAPRNSNLFTF